MRPLPRSRPLKWFVCRMLVTEAVSPLCSLNASPSAGALQ